MPNPEESLLIGSLLDLIDSAFDRTSWHGPNLRGSIRGLSVEAAGWRPTQDRKSIAEIVLHAAYWKYVVRRRLTGARRGSFSLKGSNWFPIPPVLQSDQWDGFVRLLVEEHRLLRATIADLDPTSLRTRSGKSPYDRLRLIQGAASHDLYHAGQIQLLRRLHTSLG